MRTTYGSNVKFILMNSFSTSDDTRAFLNKSHADLVAVSGVLRGIRARVRAFCGVCGVGEWQRFRRVRGTAASQEGAAYTSDDTKAVSNTSHADLAAFQEVGTPLKPESGQGEVAFLGGGDPRRMSFFWGGGRTRVMTPGPFGTRHTQTWWR
jgi:hypothetical protein